MLSLGNALVKRLGQDMPKARLSLNARSREMDAPLIVRLILDTLIPRILEKFTAPVSLDQRWKFNRNSISIAPVGNQRYYDTIYQERYMGLPRDNVEGFRKGSPVTYAHQLEGNLLLIHGTGDDNCHYQGTEAVINELVRHNKPFSMMAYPNRSHSIYEGVNTSRHLRSLMLRYFLDNLPPGPDPRVADF